VRIEQLQVKDEHFFEDDDRHRILEAIEEQAKNMSMARGANQHRLSDWLNAAEEVMPEMRKPNVKSMSAASAEGRSNSSNLMGVLLGGTFLLTLSGVGGFGFYQLNQQIQTLTLANEALKAQVAEVETQVNEVSDLVEKYKANVQAAVIEKVAPVESVANAPLAASETGANAVETLLDARFKQLIDLLDQRMKMPVPAPMQSIQPIAPLAAPSSLAAAPLQVPSITQPTAPVVAEVKPASSTQRVGNSDQEAHPNQWLFNLPSDALVIQLGSSVKADAFAEMMKKIRQQPELARVLAVTANGSTRYVLTYGGFTSRDEARKASDRLKQELGVSPWIRKASDVKQLAQKPE